MGLFVKPQERKEYPLIKEGFVTGVCYQIIDLGTHHDAMYKKDRHKVLFGFELPSVRVDYERDGVKQNKARVLSRNFTMLLSDNSALLAVLVSWLGRSIPEAERQTFDLQTLLGQPALIQIMHKKSDAGKVSARIENINQFPEGMPIPKLENPLVFFSLADAFPGQDMPQVPDWIKGEIASSKEWQEMNGLTPDKPTTLEDDEIQFV